MNNLNRSMTRNHNRKEELDINLPPNFNLYAEEEKQDDELVFEDYPRLGETNPSTNPAKKSNIINFESKEMQKYDLDKMLNPHQNDLEIMGNELDNFREKVKNQNDEVLRLEEMKKGLEGQSFQNENYDFDEIRREKEILRQALMTQKIEGDGFFDQTPVVTKNLDSDKVINFEGGNFFDNTEVIVENNNGYVQNDLFNQSVNYVQSPNTFNTSGNYVQNMPNHNPNPVQYVNQSINQNTGHYVQNQPQQVYVQNQPKGSYLQNQPQGRSYLQNQPKGSYLQNTSFQNQPRTSYYNNEGYQQGKPNVVRNSYISGNESYIGQKTDNNSFVRKVYNNY